MINYLLMFFIFLSGISRPLFNPNLWGLNLLIIFVCRAFYSLGFFWNYVQFKERFPEDDKEYTFTKSNVIAYIGKNLIVLLICSFSTYISVLWGLYSLYTFATYIKITGIRVDKKRELLYKSIALLIYIGAPIGMYFVISNIIYFDIHPMISDYVPADIILNVIYIMPILLGLIFYFFPGRLYASLPLKKMYKYYNKLILGQWSDLPKIRAVALVLLITIPSFLIIGTIAGTPMKESYLIPVEGGKYHLATDVYYSPMVGKNPAPVIFVRSPYGIREIFPEIDTGRYCAMGYHVVTQDTRFTYGSSGGRDTLLFTNAYTDGTKTIEWIMNQTWCDGHVGTSGISAMAINGYLYAGMGPKGLTAQTLWIGTPDLIADAMVEGAYREQLVNMWVEMTSPRNWRYQLNYVYDLINDIDHINESEAYNAVTLSDGINTYDKVNVSALHVGGWYDIFLGGTIRGYKGYNTLGGTGARGKQKMIIGPWTHGMVFGGRQGDVVYPRNSDGLGLIMNWEDQMLSYGLRGIEPEGFWDNRVVYYVCGDPNDPKANYWEYSSDWPLSYSIQPWYFAQYENNTLKLVKDSDILNFNQRNISYLYDPVNPVLTWGGNNLLSNPVGPTDQRETETDIITNKLRNDILLFESDLLSEAITFEGDLKAKLYVKSNCTDTDFMVKLCDVYPDGRRILIQDAALSARYRNVNFTQLIGPEHIPSEEYMIPNKEYELNIDLTALAYRFNKGHKIAISITSSNYNRFAINANTGKLTDHWSQGLIANNTLITGPGKSAIWFPIKN